MDVPGRGACRYAVVSSVTFRWYLPISIPYLLRRTPFCLLLLRGGSYMYASTVPQVPPLRFLRLVIESFLQDGLFTISLTFTVDFFDFSDLSTSRFLLMFVLMYEQSFTGRFQRSNFCSCRFILVLLFIFFHCFSLSFLVLSLFAFCRSRSSNVRHRSFLI